MIWNVMKSFASVEWVMIYNFIDRFDTVNEPESKKSEAKSCSLRPYAKKWIHFGFFIDFVWMKWCFRCEFSDNIIARTWFAFNWCFGIRIFDVKCPDSSFYSYELNVNVLNRNKMSKGDKKFESHYKAMFLAKI